MFARTRVLINYANKRNTEWTHARNIESLSISGPLLCLPKAHWLSVPRFIIEEIAWNFPHDTTKIVPREIKRKWSHSLTKIFHQFAKTGIEKEKESYESEIKNLFCVYLSKEVRARSGGDPVSVQVTVQGGVARGEGLAGLAGLAPGLGAGGEGGAPRGVHRHGEGPLQLELWSRVICHWSWRKYFLSAINLVNNLPETLDLVAKIQRMFMYVETQSFSEQHH